MQTPKISLLLTELPRCLLEIVSIPFAPYLYNVPKAPTHPILVLPGFLGGDGSTYILRRYLRKLGHITYGWGQGRNLGPREGTLDRLEEHFDRIYKTHKEPITLIGHSLGGIYAREMAKDKGTQVRSIITLGTPLCLEGTLPTAVDLFEGLNNSITAEWVDEVPKAPSQPMTLIWTKGDGIVPPGTCKQHPPMNSVQEIEVKGSHTGLGSNPSVLYTIARTLSYT